jgi:hypothetical protein
MMVAMVLVMAMMPVMLEFMVAVMPSVSPEAIARLGVRHTDRADAEGKRRGRNDPGRFHSNAEHGPFSIISGAFCA